MDIQFNFKENTTWHNTYFRNNKSGGVKNLRCFPDHSEGGHKSAGFCGSSLIVEMQVPTVFEQRYQVYAHFIEYTQRESILQVNSIVPEGTIKRSTKSSDHILCDWFSGEVVNTIHQSGGKSLISVEINREKRGWHYGWRGSKHTVDVKHCLVVYLLFTNESNQMICVHRLFSPPFQIFCRRRHMKEETPAIDSIKRTMSSSSSPSNETNSPANNTSSTSSNSSPNSKSETHRPLAPAFPMKLSDPHNSYSQPPYYPYEYSKRMMRTETPSLTPRPFQNNLYTLPMQPNPSESQSNAPFPNNKVQNPMDLLSLLSTLPPTELQQLSQLVKQLQYYTSNGCIYDSQGNPMNLLSVLSSINQSQASPLQPSTPVVAPSAPSPFPSQTPYYPAQQENSAPPSVDPYYETAPSYSPYQASLTPSMMQAPSPFLHSTNPPSSLNSFGAEEDHPYSTRPLSYDSSTSVSYSPTCLFPTQPTTESRSPYDSMTSKESSLLSLSKSSNAPSPVQLMAPSSPSTSSLASLHLPPTGVDLTAPHSTEELSLVESQRKWKSSMDPAPLLPSTTMNTLKEDSMVVPDPTTYASPLSLLSSTNKDHTLSFDTESSTQPPPPTDPATTCPTDNAGMISAPAVTINGEQIPSFITSMNWEDPYTWDTFNEPCLDIPEHEYHQIRDYMDVLQREQPEKYNQYKKKPPMIQGKNPLSSTIYEEEEESGLEGSHKEPQEPLLDDDTSTISLSNSMSFLDSDSDEAEPLLFPTTHYPSCYEPPPCSEDPLEARPLLQQPRRTDLPPSYPAPLPYSLPVTYPPAHVPARAPSFSSNQNAPLYPPRADPPAIPPPPSSSPKEHPRPSSSLASTLPSLSKAPLPPPPKAKKQTLTKSLLISKRVIFFTIIVCAFIVGGIAAWILLAEIDSHYEIENSSAQALFHFFKDIHQSTYEVSQIGQCTQDYKRLIQKNEKSFLSKHSDITIDFDFLRKHYQSLSNGCKDIVCPSDRQYLFCPPKTAEKKVFSVKMITSLSAFIIILLVTISVCSFDRIQQWCEQLAHYRYQPLHTEEEESIEDPASRHSSIHS